MSYETGWIQHDDGAWLPPRSGVTGGTFDARTQADAILPVGMLAPYVGATAPTGWLLCDGNAIPAQYTDLIAMIGANTPNLKGKVIVGLDAAQTEFDTLAETSGAKTVTIGTGNLPAHTHGLNGHTHSTNTQASQVVHGHGMNNDNTSHGHGSTTAENVTSIYYDANAPGVTTFTPSGAARWINTVAFNGVSGGHTHPVPSANAVHSHGGATQNATTSTSHSHPLNAENGNTTNGGFAGTAVSILQPYIVYNYIIKAA